MKTLEDECQHKQQKKELVGKVKTVDPIGESVVPQHGTTIIVHFVIIP